MTIIESYIESKTGLIDDCEDGIFVSNDFIAVIDGTTSKSFKKYDGLTSGIVGKQIILECLENLKSDVSAEEAVKQMSSSIFSFYKEENILEDIKSNMLEKITITIAVYSRKRKEVWMVGDCQCIVDGIVYDSKKNIDVVLAEVRAYYLLTELAAGKSVEDLMEYDSGREFILPLLKRQRVFQNNPNLGKYSFGVIDGFEVHHSHIKVIDASKSEKVVLASDGYPFLFDTLYESEVHLKNIIVSDPLCIERFKSTKGVSKNNISFDDRAYIKFELE